MWVLGDQLNRDLAALAGATPASHRVLLVESDAKLASKRWHRQRAHLVLASMRRFAAELRAEGFDVDHRRAASFAAGLAAHRREHEPAEVVASEPLSWDGLRLLGDLGVRTVRTNQFLCHHEDFAAWAGTRTRLRMEDFYRWQRARLGYLMDGDQPAGGRWNWDEANREPPPKDGREWPSAPEDDLDELDADVLASLPATTWGADPDGTWATTRAGAQRRLAFFVEHVLPRFGPHEDAMLRDDWHLAHARLSHCLNLGLLLPGEVADAVEEAYRAGHVPIASAEGFLRQVIGWREYVWGVFWRFMPGYRDENVLEADLPLPPVYTGAPTRMACVGTAVGAVHDHAYTHHIQRLMLLGNLSLLAGVRPQELVDWMWESFIDGAEWVMVPNVIGMALHADGGRMATKPYAGGGAYINRMSDYCRGCWYDPKRRTGERACPFTTLYWDFLARHRERWARNERMRQQVRGLDRLGDLDEVRSRAVEVRGLLARGEL